MVNAASTFDAWIICIGASLATLGLWWCMWTRGISGEFSLLSREVWVGQNEVSAADCTLKYHGCKCAGEHEGTIKVQQSRRFNLRFNEGYAVERE